MIIVLNIWNSLPPFQQMPAEHIYVQGRGDINKRILDLSVLGGIVDDIAPPILTWGDYQALSYDWGDSKSTGTIYINSQPLEVPRNLEAALRVVQREMKPNTVSMMWADAICINQ
jgi:hypothetical protein